MNVVKGFARVLRFRHSSLYIQFGVLEPMTRLFRSEAATAVGHEKTKTLTAVSSFHLFT